MVTMQDVANYVGVSKASVSRVVNGLPVATETQTKISEAMQLLGYHPNLLARALTTRKNQVVGVIVSARLTANCIGTEYLFLLLEKTSDQKRPVCLVRDKGDIDSFRAAFCTLVEQRCVGVVYLCMSRSAAFAPENTMIELTRIYEMPVVLIEADAMTPDSSISNDTLQQPLNSRFYAAGKECQQQHLLLDDCIEQSMLFFCR